MSRRAKTGAAKGRGRRGDRLGYTMVEVMMGMSLLAIGAAAVISMQRASIQSNLEARKLDMANSIAREWLERLRRDATQWTLPTGTNTTSNYGNALLLSTYLAIGASQTTAWSYPSAYLASATVPDGVSPGFDILGRDLKATDILGTASVPSKAIFCTNIRLNWLVPNYLIRTEVRVLWLRLLSSGANTADWCNQANANTVTGDTSHYHFIYAVSAVGKNPAQL
jgi:prepilin-type N-terminal cleavage/methylation domain-containing protein